ncbi:MAG TPA: UDP-N-acetylmuramoyl-tripeptide--D-alanyl-D-alanine ligase [bacterium]|nr:UDP-N-acetylmuramoyl-tripeptide--D-alanyl-D-alanine ligase [bacterium]
MKLDWSSILTIIGGHMTGRPDRPYCGVGTDTRTIQPGQVFVALEGERFDGHAFIGPALAEKQCPVLVRRGMCPDYTPRIEVEDPLAAMQALAEAVRSRFNGPVVAITGSHGKTTTKDMLAALLSRKWRTHCTFRNLNGLIGVPLTLLDMPPETEVLVVEVGISKPGEMSRLARVVQPTLALITCIAPAHSEFLPTLETILHEKWQLIEALRWNGTGLLNADDPLLGLRAGNERIRTYGLDTGEYRAKIQVTGPDGQVIFMKTPSGRSLEIPVGLPGRHNAANALAACAAAHLLGVPTDIIRSGLERISLSPHRARLIHRDGFTVIDDTYNAAPRSMESALAMLNSMPCDGRRIAVLGDMLELGALSLPAHRALAAVIARLELDQVLAFGPLMETMCDAARPMGVRCRHFVDRQSLLSYLQREIRPDDLILIKASRSMNAEIIVAGLVPDPNTTAGS